MRRIRDRRQRRDFALVAAAHRLQTRARMRTVLSTSLLVVIALGSSRPAHALQPLEEFVRGARAHNPVNEEARAEQAAAAARSGEALGHALPAISAVGTYARNEREVAIGGATFVPLNQVDGSVAVTVPLLDLTRFVRVSAANRLADSAAYREQEVAREAEAETAQLYYQLAANLGLVKAARRALEVVEVNLTMTEQTARAGTATALDVQRASAEVERQRQQLTSAELAVQLAARALASRTQVVPDTAVETPLGDDLHAEPPLAQFLTDAPSTPAVKTAALAREAAERNATAQALTLVPALTGSASERYTNATALLGGHHEAYTLALSLFWAFDLGTPAGIRARNAEAAGAAAREREAALLTGDAIFGAWNTIEADIARCRSARAQAAVSARAAEIARARYRSGVATQLDMIQADRDAFAAEAGRIQSDADLLNARLQLRLAASRAK
jgi:outer membrane protein TolC